MSDQVKYRGVNELRQMFLDFFESKGHLKMKSFSLVPHILQGRRSLPEEELRHVRNAFVQVILKM